MLRKFIQKSGANMSSFLGNQKKSQSQIYTGVQTQESTAEKSSATFTNTPGVEKQQHQQLSGLKSNTPGQSLAPTAGTTIHQVISSGSFNSFSKGAEPVKVLVENSKHRIRVLARGNQTSNFLPRTESLKAIAPCPVVTKKGGNKMFNSASQVTELVEHSSPIQPTQLSLREASVDGNQSGGSSPFYMLATSMEMKSPIGTPYTPVKYTVGKYKKQRQEEVFEHIIKADSGIRGIQTARNSQVKITERPSKTIQLSNLKMSISQTRSKELVKSSFFKTMLDPDNRSIEESVVTPRHDSVSDLRFNSREALFKNSVIKPGVHFKFGSQHSDKQELIASSSGSKLPLLTESGSFITNLRKDLTENMEGSIVQQGRVHNLTTGTISSGQHTPTKNVRARGPIGNLPNSLVTSLSKFKVIPANKRNWGLLGEPRDTPAPKLDLEAYFE
jgi:hypothetical protein